MKKIEKYLNQSEDKKYYESRFKKLSDEQKEILHKLVINLDNEGAKSPLGWAFSETQEGIPQFSRFLFLKEIFKIIDDVEENKGLADDVDENYEEDIFEISEKLENHIGKNKFNDFLKSYTKGVMWQVLNLIDEGNYNNKNKPMWGLKEVDTDKNISGLHENYNDFEKELKNNA